MLRIPHCLDNRLINGGMVVSPTHQPHFTPQKHYYFNVSGTLHFQFRRKEKRGSLCIQACTLHAGYRMCLQAITCVTSGSQARHEEGVTPRTLVDT
jgi:hypothetical protein